MRAIINIELADMVGPGLTQQQRFDAVLSRVRQFFTRSIGELQQARYTNPNGDIVKESVAVITFEHAVPKAAVLATLHKISIDFNQDCIAVLFCSGEGRLAGPNADLWGPFKRDFFRTPSFFDLAKAA